MWTWEVASWLFKVCKKNRHQELVPTQSQKTPRGFETTSLEAFEVEKGSKLFSNC